jgi:hypothetical protein
MNERISRIVKSPLAKGQEQLAAVLCASPCSIEEAVGALQASHRGLTGADDDVESTARRILAAGKSSPTPALGEAEAIAARILDAGKNAKPKAARPAP